jgi:hypothetical protein
VQFERKDYKSGMLLTSDGGPCVVSEARSQARSSPQDDPKAKLDAAHRRVMETTEALAMLQQAQALARDPRPESQKRFRELWLTLKTWGVL